MYSVEKISRAGNKEVTAITSVERNYKRQSYYVKDNTKDVRIRVGMPNVNISLEQPITTVFKFAKHSTTYKYIHLALIEFPR